MAWSKSKSILSILISIDNLEAIWILWVQEEALEIAMILLKLLLLDFLVIDIKNNNQVDGWQ